MPSNVSYVPQTISITLTAEQASQFTNLASFLADPANREQVRTLAQNNYSQAVTEPIQFFEDAEAVQPGTGGPLTIHLAVGVDLSDLNPAKVELDAANEVTGDQVQINASQRGELIEQLNQELQLQVLDAGSSLGFAVGETAILEPLPINQTLRAFIDEQMAELLSDPNMSLEDLRMLTSYTLSAEKFNFNKVEGLSAVAKTTLSLIHKLYNDEENLISMVSSGQSEAASAELLAQTRSRLTNKTQEMLAAFSQRPSASPSSSSQQHHQPSTSGSVAEDIAQHSTVHLYPAGRAYIPTVVVRRGFRGSDIAAPNAFAFEEKITRYRSSFLFHPSSFPEQFVRTFLEAKTFDFLDDDANFINLFDRLLQQMARFGQAPGGLPRSEAGQMALNILAVLSARPVSREAYLERLDLYYHACFPNKPGLVHRFSTVPSLPAWTDESELRRPQQPTSSMSFFSNWFSSSIAPPEPTNTLIERIDLAIRTTFPHGTSDLPPLVLILRSIAMSNLDVRDKAAEISTVILDLGRANNGRLPAGHEGQLCLNVLAVLQGYTVSENRFMEVANVFLDRTNPKSSPAP